MAMSCNNYAMRSQDARYSRCRAGFASSEVARREAEDGSTRPPRAEEEAEVETEAEEAVAWLPW